MTNRTGRRRRHRRHKRSTQRNKLRAFANHVIELLDDKFLRDCAALMPSRPGDWSITSWIKSLGVPPEMMVEKAYRTATELIYGGRL